jgi:hypothetical protein
MVSWYWLRLTHNLSTRALWQPPIPAGRPVSRDISGSHHYYPAVLPSLERVGEWNENLIYPFPWDFKRSIACRKIVWRGTSGFTSHLKEGALRIFIALKNPSSWPGSNSQPLGPVASTLTITPPRRLESRAWYGNKTRSSCACATHSTVIQRKS